MRRGYRAFIEQMRITVQLTEKAGGEEDVSPHDEILAAFVTSQSSMQVHREIHLCSQA